MVPLTLIYDAVANRLKQLGASLLVNHDILSLGAQDTTVTGQYLKVYKNCAIYEIKETKKLKRLGKK